MCCEILQNPFAGFDSIREMVRGYFFKIFRDKFRMIMISKVCVLFRKVRFSGRFGIDACFDKKCG